MTMSYFAFIYKKLDPAADKIQEMNVIKYSGKAVADFKGAYVEKDKNDQMYITMPKFSDKLYRVTRPGRTTILNYLNEIDSKITI